MAALHITALWSLAVAQPLFDVLSNSPEFFVTRHNQPVDLVLLALGATLVGPAVLVGVEALLSRAPHVRRAVHLVFVGALVAAILAQGLDQLLDGGGWLAVAVAVATAVGIAFAYGRFPAIRSFATALAPVPLIVVVSFLFFSPVTKVVFPEETAAAEGGTSQTPVVMVIFDELSTAGLLDSKGRIDAAHYPNFAALAKKFTWYPNHTTAADDTTRAVPSLLTGEQPVHDTVPAVTDHPNNLFTLLSKSHSFNVHEPETNLCPRRLCPETEGTVQYRMRYLAEDLSVVSLRLLLPSDVDVGLPPVDRSFGGFRDQAGADDEDDAGASAPSFSQNRPRLYAAFEQAIGRRSERPPLNFLHIELPHIPWEYLADGRRYAPGPGDPPGARDERWSAEPILPQLSLQRYLIQLQYADRLIGRLLRRLKATGLYDRSAIVVTADHGVAFRPGDMRRPVTKKNFGEIVPVPLFIKGPKQARGRVDASYSLSVDVLPTLARHMGLGLRWKTEGVPLQTKPRARPRRLRVVRLRGGTVEVSTGELRRELRAAVAEKAALFGAQGAFFRMGRNADSIGRPVSDLLDDATSEGAVTLDAGGRYRSVDPNGDFIPALVSGRIENAGGRSLELAVAVNGTIGAVTRSYRWRGAERFSALVEPRRFKSGRNDVELYRVRTVGQRKRLVALGTGP